MMRGKSKVSEKGDLDIVIYEAHLSRPHFEVVLRAKNEKAIYTDSEEDEDRSSGSDSDATSSREAPRTHLGMDFSKITQYRSAHRRGKVVGAEEAATVSDEMDCVTWACIHGRHNLFQALTLFLFFIKKYRSGYLGDANLRKAIELLQIID